MSAKKQDSEDIEDMSDSELMMADDEDESANALFWSMTVEPEQENMITEPSVPGFIVHVTSACFGAAVNKNSRSVVTIKTEEETEAHPICVLSEGKLENVQLDLLFNEAAVLSVTGSKPSKVYLSGYIQPNINDMDAMREDMDDEELQQLMRERGAALDEEDDEDLEEEEVEIEEPPQKKQKTNTTAAKATKKEATKNGQEPKQNAKKNNNKNKASTDDEKESKATEAAKEAVTEQTENKANNKKKEDKKKMQTMKGGVQFRDMHVGDGEAVQNGQKAKVYYVGQLDDKKIFDKCISDEPFTFTVGKGEVIKGWDVGIKGMKVGGKRKLVIPAKMAYGKEGSAPEIPANATLTFTIELKGIEK